MRAWPLGHLGQCKKHIRAWQVWSCNAVRSLGHCDSAPEPRGSKKNNSIQQKALPRAPY